MCTHDGTYAAGLCKVARALKTHRKNVPSSLFGRDKFLPSWISLACLLAHLRLATWSYESPSTWAVVIVNCQAFPCDWKDGLYGMQRILCRRRCAAFRLTTRQSQARSSARGPGNDHQGKPDLHRECQVTLHGHACNLDRFSASWTWVAYAGPWRCLFTAYSSHNAFSARGNPPFRIPAHQPSKSPSPWCRGNHTILWTERQQMSAGKQLVFGPLQLLWCSHLLFRVGTAPYTCVCMIRLL